MAVGAGKIVKGKRIPVDVRVGDRILFGKYTGNDIRIDDSGILDSPRGGGSQRQQFLMIVPIKVPTMTETSWREITFETGISTGMAPAATVRPAQKHMNLHVDGYVEGSISVGGHRVTVGQTAHINAETVAGEVVRTYGQLALVQVHVGLKAYR